MKRTAFLFPGQGSQAPGMGRDFAASFSIAKETFEEANDALGRDLSKVIFEGSAEELTQTKNSQPAIFVVSAAILRVLNQQIPDVQPAICSGLSLGEYTALWASGRIGFKEALLLVQKRADLMNEACEKTRGTMAAVLGLSGEEVENAVKGIEGVWVANYNCPGQVVISGTLQGVELASQALKSRGAKRVILLPVHGAFHSGLMKSAEEGLAPVIAKVPLMDSKIGFVMNVPGQFVENPSDIRTFLTEQVTHSVRWEQGMKAMDQRGVDEYLEIGFGKTLVGLGKKMGLSAPLGALEKIEDLETLACSC